MRLKHQAQLELHLDRALSWRKKELTTTRFLAEGATRAQLDVMVRCAVALLYAHWEGFVKEAATAYVQYVALQNLRLRDLQPPFIAVGTRGDILACASARRVSVHTKLVRMLTSGLDRPARLQWKRVINTRSNLKAAVLAEITATLGLDFAPFALKAKPVIDHLVDARNGIAHGRGNRISLGDYVALHVDIIIMLDVFRAQISAAVASRAFRI